MKTESTQLTDESKARAVLFRSLFLLQIQLERHSEAGCCYRDEIRRLIGSIDQLMEAMLDVPSI